MSKHKSKPIRAPQKFTPLAVGTNVTLLRTPELSRLVAGPAADSYRLGCRLRAKNLAIEAIAAFRQALTLTPDLAEASNELGLTLIQQNDLAAALSVFKSGLERQPTHSILLNNLGCLWLKLGDYAAAEQVLQLAIQVTPLQPAVQTNLAIAQREARLGQGGTAVEAAHLSNPAPKSTGRETVSLCLIAKNEALNLPRLFKSLEGAVDEMIVVDTGSTDETVTLARSLKARVVSIPWQKDFAAAKNEALRQATGDWVLFLDADMALHEGHAEKIRQTVASGKAQAYYVLINSPLPDGVSEDLIAQPWLFRRKPGVKFEGAIHEIIFDSLMSRGMQPVHTDIVIYHYGYASTDGMRPRFERNLAALEADLAKGKTRPILNYYLGTTLLGLNRPAEAIPALQKAIATPELFWRVRANAQLALVRAYAANGQAEAADDCADDAVTLYPKDRMAWTFRGKVAVHRHNWAKAADSFQQALALNEILGAEANVQRVTDAGLELELGTTLAWAGRLTEAVNHFARALDHGLPPPTADQAQTALAFIEFTQGRLVEAQRQTSGQFGEQTWDFLESIATSNNLEDQLKPFGSWLYSIGIQTDAVKARLGKPLNASSTYVDDLIQSAHVLREAGELGRSVHKLQQALSIEPRRAGLNYELGASYVQSGDRLQAARAYIAELSVTPKHSASAHDIGVLYAQEQNYAEAVSWFQLSLTLDPNNALASRHLQEFRTQLAG